MEATLEIVERDAGDAAPGTSAAVSTRPAHWSDQAGTVDKLEEARAIADGVLAAVDRACSRFHDSELTRLNAAGGAARRVSVEFKNLLKTALNAADATGGDVDPTCGGALVEIGYDRDIEELRAAGAELGQRTLPPGHIPGWQAVHLDEDARVVWLEGRGTQIDLGSTAKAWAADKCAEQIAKKLGVGVLVNLGGDIAVAGPPPKNGWEVRVTDDHAAPPGAPGQTVFIGSGGLATSGTTVRNWVTSDGKIMHHIIDPMTGQPAESPWRTVSVAAGNCVDANTASTAAIIRGEAAPDWLAGQGLPARLVHADGSVVTVAGWPEDHG
jgi:thiamine biosynthesis lipoprotein